MSKIRTNDMPSNDGCPVLDETVERLCTSVEKFRQLKDTIISKVNIIMGGEKSPKDESRDITDRERGGLNGIVLNEIDLMDDFISEINHQIMRL